MKLRLTFLLAALLFLASFTLAETSTTQPTTQPVISGKIGQPIDLFNGKDLAGWVWVTGAKEVKMDQVWSVVDGNLHCIGKPPGYIRTEGTYTNYIFRAQIRHLTKGNGGVLVRMTGEDKVWPKSIEAQGNRGTMGDIFNIDQFKMTTDPARTKGRQTVRLHPKLEEKPLGEWNDYEIILDGGNLTITLNGVVQNTASDVDEVAGHICLQSEGATYEFRHIILTPIEK